MKPRLFSLRLFQALCAVSTLIAVLGGGSFVLNGADGVALAVGAEYPALVPRLEAAAASIDSVSRGTFDTWYRALGWYWVVTGLMMIWVIPNIETQWPWIRFIHIGFMGVVVANIFTILDTGTNAHPRFDP